MGFITLVEITEKKAEGRQTKVLPNLGQGISMLTCQREREKKKGPPKRNSKGRPEKGEKMQRG